MHRRSASSDGIRPRLSVRAATLAGATLAIMSVAAPALAETEILFNRFTPPNDIVNTKVIEPWAKSVEEVTEGRVKIKFAPTNLASPQQQWEMVTQGIADATYLFNGFQQNRLLLPPIAHLPFLGPSAEAGSIALWKTYKTHFEKAKEYEGVALLGFIVMTTGQFYSLTDTPLDSVERFKNLKTWSLPAVPARALDTLGASIVPGPAVRIHDIVSKGVVDAFVGIGLYHAEAYNGIQFAKSITYLPGGISAPAYSVIMNKDKWQSISKRDQELLMSVSGEKLGRMSRAYDDADKEAWDRFLKAGGKRIEASPEMIATFKEKWAFLEEEWIANAAKRKVDGKAALAYYKQQLEQATAASK